MAETSQATISVPVEIARIIDQVFLPANPNKMRSAAPEVIAAAKEFRRLLSMALRPKPRAEAEQGKATDG